MPRPAPTDRIKKQNKFPTAAAPSRCCTPCRRTCRRRRGSALCSAASRWASHRTCPPSCSCSYARLGCCKPGGVPAVAGGVVGLLPLGRPPLAESPGVAAGWQRVVSVDAPVGIISGMAANAWTVQPRVPRPA